MKIHIIQKIKITRLKEIGLKIGSDVPACITGKSLKLSGIGERLKIYVAKNYKFLLVYPNKILSTKSFNNFNLSNTNKSKPMYFNKIKIYNSRIYISIS